MEKQVHIFIPGIHTFPGASRNWCGRAVTWCHKHLYEPAEKVEYFTLAVTRPLRQKARAKKLVSTLSHYFNAESGKFHISIAAHSNGCDVVLDALNSMKKRGTLGAIDRVDFISGACEADASKNGMNELARYIRRIAVYIAEKDRALELASSRIGQALGYGTLGVTGFTHAHFHQFLVERVSYGHSTWFDDKHFDGTMQMLTRRESDL